jgi:hypothetical protein
MAGSRTVHPQSPAGLRLAKPTDIPRIAIVATAGFYYSPFFHFTRPNHKFYPEDTLLSYQSQFTSLIGNDEFVVCVAEDEYEPDERGKSEAKFPEEISWVAPKSGEKVIVGVIIVKLAPGSKLKGAFKAESEGSSRGVRELNAVVLTSRTGTFPDLPANPGRDLNKAHFADALRNVAEVQDR